MKEILKDRTAMDRRRLEEGFLLFAAVVVINKYRLPIEVLPCDRNDLSELVAKQYHDAFVKKWGGKVNITCTLLNNIIDF